MLKNITNLLIYSALNHLKSYTYIRVSRVGKPSKQVVFAESAFEHVRPRTQQFGQLSVYNTFVSALQIRAEVQSFNKSGILVRK